MTRVEYENVDVAVIMHVGGSLRLKGQRGDSLTVDGDAAYVEQLGEGQPYVVNCSSDCTMVVPSDVPISVQSVGGGAKLTDMDATVDVQSVGGDLTLRSMAGIRAKSIGGDLRIKRADGDVTVESVGGDATIREVSGSVRVTSIGSDLYIRNVDGSCVVENVGSDLVLSLDFSPDQEYRFMAGSDVLCRIQPDTNVRFVLPLDVELRLDVPAEVIEVEDEGQQIVTLGEGGPDIFIDRCATLRLVGEEEDYMINLGIQIEEELEARLSTLEDTLNERLAGLDERIQAKAEHWASQAEKLAERAQRQAERTVERARRSLERKSPKRKTVGVVTRRDRLSTTEPVTEQERLMILQMVQENQITIEEAERLLSALESRS
jgi:hypothetical protein